MARIVMKFGGTSMAGIERIRHVAGLVKREADRGNHVAVVVSAMAGETDRLVQMCREAAARLVPFESTGEEERAGPQQERPSGQRPGRGRSRPSDSRGT